MAKVGHPNFGQSRSIKVGQSRSKFFSQSRFGQRRIGQSRSNKDGQKSVWPKSVSAAGRHHTSDGEKNVVSSRFSLSLYSGLAEFQACFRAHLFFLRMYLLGSDPQILEQRNCAHGDKWVESPRVKDFLSRLSPDCRTSEVNRALRLGLDEWVPFRRFDLNFDGSAS